MYNSFICRYHEIAIKGGNRYMFEAKLMENISMMISSVKDTSVYRVRGRVLVGKNDKSPFTDGEIDVISNALSMAFGLESFSPAVECEKSIDSIFNAVAETVKPVFNKQFALGKSVVSFGVRARRSDKNFPLRSNELEIKAAEITDNLIGSDKLKVDLENPDIWIGIEVRETCAFIYYDIYNGPGGLPVGSNSSILALLSGGIDSPVACYMGMKRGCHVDYLTFHSHPYTTKDAVEKVRRIATFLTKREFPATLHVCNLAPIQKMIRDLCTAKYRTVLYRRMMLRVAEEVCKNEKLEAILTGEAVGQVASQTVANLSVINAATSMLVLRPMLGMDKRESVDMARKIGTYEMSIEPVADSCTVFAPPAPALASKLPIIEEEEQRLGDWKSVIHEIVLNIEKIEV